MYHPENANRAAQTRRKRDDSTLSTASACNTVCASECILTSHVLGTDANMQFTKLLLIHLVGRIGH